MGDLISRSESIRRLKIMTNIEVIREGIETAITVIETQEDAKSVDTLEHANDNAPKWISVNEKLPTPDTRVLASAIDNDGGSIVVITEYTHRLYGLGVTGWIEPWQYFSCNYKITHWMTLPEAPKGGIKNENY